MLWPWKVLGPVVGLLLLVMLSLMAYVLRLFMVRVKLGKPPVEKLSIAYKYAYMGKSTFGGLFNRFQCLFPACRGIKVCYSGPKASYIEYAYGVILSEDAKTTVQMKQELRRNTFSMFTTPEISYAMFLILPVISWLPITSWIAVAIGYIKIYNFSQKHNLCAYPVFEVYENGRIYIIVPLMRQDEFVVWQAERIVHGKTYSAMLRPMTLFKTQVATPANPPSNTPKSPRKLKEKKKKG